MSRAGRRSRKDTKCRRMSGIFRYPPRFRTDPTRRRVATAMTWLRCVLLGALSILLGLAAFAAARAEETIDRPVTIYVAGTAGGGVDLYARLLARHFGRHIRGRPNVTVQVMP